MNKKLVIGIASTLLLGGGVYLWTSIAKKKKQQREAETKARIAEAIKGAKSEAEKKAVAAQILAKENQETAVEEVLKEVGDKKVGMFAYPKGKDVNVRSSAKINDGTINNNIYEDYTKRVGLVTAVVDSEEYGDKYKWFKVKLDEPDMNYITPDHFYGYVREDVITLKNI
jgi:type II secretory pathway pseudopilin PulG